MKPAIGRVFWFCLPMYVLGAVLAAGQAGIGWDFQAATDADPAGVLIPLLAAFICALVVFVFYLGAQAHRYVLPAGGAR